MLDQQHPEREIKARVVRITLERLVAKNHARRTRQGHSIFYTSQEAFEPSSEEPAISEA
jgi:predicted transcriptional regulator